MRLVDWCSATIIGLGLAVLLGTAPALACGKNKILFEDNFQSLDPSWGSADKQMTVEGGNLVLRPNAGFYRWALSQSDFYGDSNLCSDVNIVETSEPEATSAGILFWGSDTANMYGLMVASNGYFQVFRRSRGRWLFPVAWRQHEAIKQGANQWNVLQVQMKGNQATFLINDVQVAQINGNPPDGGGLVGIAGASPQAAPATIRFRKYQLESSGPARPGR